MNKNDISLMCCFLFFALIFKKAKMGKVICLWCGERLFFVPGKGWLHESTGTLYKTRQMTTEEIEKFIKRHNRPPTDSEKIIDDHCAMPKFVDST